MQVVRLDSPQVVPVIWTLDGKRVAQHRYGWQ
jgi:hypothetical protein